MTFIQILRSCCKLASKYIISGVDLETEVDLKVREPSLREFSLKKPEVAELSSLAVHSLSFAVFLLSYAIALLEAGSLSDSLRAVKSRGRFFEGMAILEKSKKEKRKF